MKRQLKLLRMMLYEFLVKRCLSAHKLPCPDRIDEKGLFDLVTSVRVDNAPEDEMKAYGTGDFRRFVYTWGMAKDIQGKCLELGANPYFTTILLKHFTELELSLGNFFGQTENGEFIQGVSYLDPVTYENKHEDFKYHHFNVETDEFPYPDNFFDLVIFAEILEHLLNDPCKVLREIKRVLKDDGTLILTTPNVCRLENVSKIIKGENIYDPYSGYGPYGRHNREYTCSEISSILQYEGFKINNLFTSDGNFHNIFRFQKVKMLLKKRDNDLGHYIFVKAKLVNKVQNLKRPSWLYRSLPPSDLV